MELNRMRYSTRPAQGKTNKRRSKKKLGGLIVLLIGLLLGLYTYAAVAKPLPQIHATVRTIRKPAVAPAVSWPSGVDAAIGSTTGGVLAKSSAEEYPRSIASLAKVITALAVISKKPITNTQENVITFTASDEALYNYYVSVGGSYVPITAGLQLSEYYALKAMLLPSSNNMADSLALWAFGSMENFTAYANQMVQSYGLTNTSVGEASGFNDTTLSTPSDLIVIGKKLLENSLLAEIVNAKQDTLPGTNTVIENTNQLLRTDIKGIKTGHTYKAGYCLLLVKDIVIDKTHSTKVISAVLGALSSDESFSASDTLTESVRKNFTATKVVSKGVVITNYTTPWGAQAEAVTEKPLEAFGWEYASRDFNVSSDVVRTPLRAGTKVGTISTINDDGSKSNVALALKSNLPGPSIWWRLTHYF